GGPSPPSGTRTRLPGATAGRRGMGLARLRHRSWSARYITARPGAGPIASARLRPAHKCRLAPDVGPSEPLRTPGGRLKHGPPMAVSRRTLLSSSLVLLGCLTVLPGVTECQAAAPPPSQAETVSAAAPREIAPDDGA